MVQPKGAVDSVKNINTCMMASYQGFFPANRGTTYCGSPWLAAMLNRERQGQLRSMNNNYCTAPHGQEVIKAGLVLRTASFRGQGENLPKEIEAWASIRGNTVLLLIATSNPVHHTSSARKRVNIFYSGELPSKCGDCGEYCPDVVPPTSYSQVLTQC